MSKQTAIDWIVEQVNSDCLNSVSIRPELILQAKAMEKEQIRDSYIGGFNERDEVNKGLFFNPIALTYCEKVFCQWYNQTYKGGDK